jgi:hypothetical protein
MIFILAVGSTWSETITAVSWTKCPVEELVVSDCRGKKEFLCRFRNGFVAFVVLDHSNFYNNNQC